MIKPKEFMEQLNDLIAPVTRAWVGAEIETVTVNPGARDEVDNDDELLVDVRLRLTKRGRIDA